MGGLTLTIEITLNNWINSPNTTSSLDIRVAPATRTRGEGGRRPPSPLVIIIIIIIIIRREKHHQYCQMLQLYNKMKVKIMHVTIWEV